MWWWQPCKVAARVLLVMMLMNERERDGNGCVYVCVVCLCGAWGDKPTSQKPASKPKKKKMIIIIIEMVLKRVGEVTRCK